ncbi:MAG: GNAT family N-acetyltransferase [Gammaproteobacteria bacterium]|jgi:GNAT superfamily N-acetyltransferase|nr:GNAT family N-acetyltransferase [Gammaproteobacteria bacterium]
MRLTTNDSIKRLIFNNFYSFFSSTCGIQKYQGCSYSAPEADFALFNSVFETNVKQENLLSVINNMKKIYQHKKQFCWWMTDFVKPKEIQEALKHEGFTIGNPFSGMFYNLTKPLTFTEELSSIHIQTVTNKEELDTWIKPLQVAFEIDDRSTAFCANALKSLFDDVRFKHYFVEVKEKVVGVGSLFTENGVSGFYNLGVLPEYRHQKIATALKYFRLKESQRLGATVAILQSSSMGKALDQKIGFNSVFDFVPYFSPTAR